LIENYELGWLIDTMNDFKAFAEEYKILSYSPKAKEEELRMLKEVLRIE
jgi:hypothetical protein